MNEEKQNPKSLMNFDINELIIINYGLNSLKMVSMIYKETEIDEDLNKLCEKVRSEIEYLGGKC